MSGVSRHARSRSSRAVASARSSSFRSTRLRVCRRRGGCGDRSACTGAGRGRLRFARARRRGIVSGRLPRDGVRSRAVSRSTAPPRPVSPAPRPVCRRPHRSDLPRSTGSSVRHAPRWPGRTRTTIPAAHGSFGTAHGSGRHSGRRPHVLEGVRSLRGAATAAPAWTPALVLVRGDRPGPHRGLHLGPRRHARRPAELSSSPAIGMPGRIWRECWPSGRRISGPRSRCATRSRATRRNRWR